MSFNLIFSDERSKVDLFSVMTTDDEIIFSQRISLDYNFECLAMNAFSN